MMGADPRWMAVTFAAWLLSYALHSTLLLGGVGFLSRWKKLPATLEQTLWKMALLGSLIIATGITLGWDGGGLGARIHLSPSLPALGLLPGEVLAQPGPDRLNAQIPSSGAWVLLVLWGVTGAWGLVRLTSARRRLEAQLAERRLVTVGSHRDVLDDLCRAAGIRRPIRLTVSAHLDSPIAIGDHEICLPERALTDLGPEEFRSALAHELAHLAHRDPGWKSFSAGLGAVFFFQPLHLAARRRLEETAEYLADDWAVRHSGGEVSLARCLATVAGWQSARQPSPRLQSVAASGMADGASPLYRRVERLLGGRRPEPAPAWCYAGGFLLLVAGWIVAPGVTTEARSPEPLAMLAALEARPELPPQPTPENIAPEVPATPRPEVRRHVVRRVRPTMPRRMLAPEALPLLRDQETAPRPRVIVVPHQAFRVRLEVLRVLPPGEALDPETLRALIEAERCMVEWELSQRGVRILWMLDPPATLDAPARTAPPAAVATPRPSAPPIIKI